MTLAATTITTRTTSTRKCLPFGAASLLLFSFFAGGQRFVAVSTTYSCGILVCCVIRYVGIALSVCSTLDNHEDVFTGNKAVLTGSNVGLSSGCQAPGKAIMGQNSYYTPDGTVKECGSSLAKWQKADASNDPGSTVAVTPEDSVIIGWARDKLIGTQH